MRKTDLKRDDVHMEGSWKHVLPVDGLRVRMTQDSRATDKQVLTQLYQPLIGAQAVNLYQTLYHRLTRGVYECEGTTHRELMIVTGENLSTLLEARRKLEGIGLLKTYALAVSEDEDRQFSYELLPPMSPQAFFSDDVLSVFLYNRTGKNKYRRLRQQFIIPDMEGDWSEVTASFNDVFTSLHPSELIPNAGQWKSESNEPLVTGPESPEVAIQENFFDFDLLYQRLPSFFNREVLLTADVRQAVSRLAFVYRVDAASMSQLIQQALVGDEEVDIHRLRKKVQEWYRMSYGQSPPALGLRTDQPDETSEKKGATKEPLDEASAAIRYYETTAPLTLLASFPDKGAKVPPADARLAESLLFDYQLNPGVANVLIDYVMRVNDRKLDRNHVEKIAGHWSRENLKTVEEAMELAKKEYKGKGTKQQKRTNTNTKTQQQKKQNQRKERLPKWLTGEMAEASDEEKRKRVNEKREKIQSLLQQHRKE
ncbi:DnaD domain protein [Salicibibacter cibarius]|uniref:DnaD domain protein n=1 Tax=Salicibibacter cibarius TaxID=2743000 RepID=A0A7T6Z5N2_9BACI|nr:DnaD domain protein [Salicibibacter cibarius]QQK77257.1 DnaD domain protein [Salicibibacter cibarius]